MGCFATSPPQLPSSPGAFCPSMQKTEAKSEGSGDEVAAHHVVHTTAKAHFHRQLSPLPALFRDTSWMKRHDVWFRHPMARLFCVFFIIVCDFFIHGMDPIQDSHAPCGLPGAGNAVTMVLGRYPSSSLLAFLKFLMWFVFLILGLLVGRKLVHQMLLRDYMKINMYEGDQGSFTIMGVFGLIGVFISSYLWNALLDSVSNDSTDLKITSSMDIQFLTFGKIAQCATWLGDLITVVMVSDTVLQDTTKYPLWFVSGKKTWNHGCNGYFRVVFVWVFCITTTTVVYIMLLYVTTEMSATEGTADLVRLWSNEGLRAALVCLIAFTDLFIVFQDWEFPAFDTDLEADVMVPGKLTSWPW